MCSLSFIPQQGKYLIGMNRDESKTRALSREVYEADNGEFRFLFPVDESAKGTWIAVSTAGVVMALLNYYPEHIRLSKNKKSRGKIIQSLLERKIQAPSELEEMLQEEKKLYNPFRLFLFSLQKKICCEYISDTKSLSVKEHSWERHLFASSSFRESEATESRKQLFQDYQSLFPKEWTQETLKKLHHLQPHKVMAHKNLFIDRLGVHTESVCLGEVDEASYKFTHLCKAGEFHYES